jgi:hypothetical protein
MKNGLEYLVSELFSNRNCSGLGPWLGIPWLLWLTVNQGAWGGSSLSELVIATTPEHGSLPVGAQQREGNIEILTRASPGLGRHDRDDKRRGLELGAREIKREGKRGGTGRGCSSPFIGPGGRRRWPG